MTSRNLRVALLTAAVILLLAIAWTIYVALQPPGVVSSAATLILGYSN